MIEFGSFLAARLCGRHLADFGMDVISVKRPENLRIHEKTYITNDMSTFLDSDKQILELDLKSAHGLSQARRLVEEADVVLENFRPGVIRRLLGDDVLSRQGLIVISLPGFSTQNLVARDMVAWESTILAHCGILKDMGLNRTLMNVVASFTHLPLASVYASIYGAMACVTALLYRETHDLDYNDTIEVPLASCLLDVLSHNTLHVHTMPRRYKSRRRESIEAGVSNLSFADVEKLCDPFFKRYECADHRSIYVVAPCHRLHQCRLLDFVFDRPWRETAAELRLTVASVAGEEHELVPPEWGIGGDRMPDDEADRLSEALRIAFRGRAAEEWVSALSERGVPVSMHRSTPEWMEHNRAGFRRYKAADDSAGDPVFAPGPVAWLESHCVEARSARSRPTTPPSIDVNKTSPLWLGHVGVLDLTNVIAGPTISHMLARFGADVTRLELPAAEDAYSGVVRDLYGLVTNRGKRIRRLHLRRDRAALDQLLRDADVVVVNATKASLTRLGLSYYDLYEINPDVIISHFDAWGRFDGGGGGDQAKGMEAIGYDDNVQSATGIMERFGGKLAEVEEHAHVGLIDAISGVAGALATTAALLRRQRHGPSATCVARASLAACAHVLQFPYCCGRMSDVYRRWQMTRSGRFVNGTSPTHSVYRVKDDETVGTGQGSYVMLVVSLDGVDAVTPASTLNLPPQTTEAQVLKTLGLPDGDGSLLRDGRAIEDAMMRHTADEWHSIFRTALPQCSCVPLKCLDEIRLESLRFGGPIVQGIHGFDRIVAGDHDTFESGFDIGRTDLSIRPLRARVLRLY